MRADGEEEDGEVQEGRRTRGICRGAFGRGGVGPGRREGDGRERDGGPVMGEDRLGCAVMRNLHAVVRTRGVLPKWLGCRCPLILIRGGGRGWLRAEVRDERAEVPRCCCRAARARGCLLGLGLRVGGGSEFFPVAVDA